MKAKKQNQFYVEKVKKKDMIAKQEVKMCFNFRIIVNYCRYGFLKIQNQ